MEFEIEIVILTHSRTESKLKSHMIIKQVFFPASVVCRQTVHTDDAGGYGTGM